MAQAVEVQKLFIGQYTPLRGFLLGLVHDQNAADDLMQEVFLAVTARAGDFREGTDFPAWARAIARLRVFEYCRARQRFPAGWDQATLELVADSAPPPEDVHARRQALDACLGQLAPRAREILDLRYGEGLLPAAIAARVSWQPAAVSVALSRARRFLRECVQRGLRRAFGP